MTHLPLLRRGARGQLKGTVPLGRGAVVSYVAALRIEEPPIASLAMRLASVFDFCCCGSSCAKATLRQTGPGEWTYSRDYDFSGASLAPASVVTKRAPITYGAEGTVFEFDALDITFHKLHTIKHARASAQG